MIKKAMVCAIAAMAGMAAWNANGDDTIDFTGIFPEWVKTIYIVAPSSHADNSTVIKATNEFIRCGYKVKVADTVWTYSEDPAKRASDIVKAWQDPETDLIICSRGGSGGAATVANLDWDVLKSRDIPFIGFSNISCLMNAFVKMGVKRPITGPLCTTLVNYPNTLDSVARLGATVAGDPLDDTQLTVLKAPEAAVTGKPIGGHWPSINGLADAYLPDTTGRIAFLEVNSSYTIDGAKSHFDSLKDRGYFSNLAAVVLCDIGIVGTTDDSATRVAEKKALIQYITTNVTCAVFQGYPYGHVSKNYAIDFGRELTISPTGLLHWSDPERSNLTLDADAGKTLEVTEPIASLTNVLVNTQGGTGVVKLSTPNTYVGSTTLGGGTLEATTLAPVKTDSSLGRFGPFYFQAGTFHYSNTEPATFGQAVTLGSAVLTLQDDGDITATGNWTQSSTGSLLKKGAGNLTFAAGSVSLSSVTVNVGQVTLASGKTTFSKSVHFGYVKGSHTKLLVTGGTHTLGAIYIGQNSAKPTGEYWSELEMTGGSVTLTSSSSLFIGNRGNGHVKVDFSGGTFTSAKNIGVAYTAAKGETKDIDVTIRDTAVVTVGGSSTAHRFYFDARKGSQRLTVKDGGKLITSSICIYDSYTIPPMILVDGGIINWKSATFDVFSYNHDGKCENALNAPILIGSKGATFTKTDSSAAVYSNNVAMVATNTVDGMAAKGVTFQNGTHVLTVANSWDGPTTIDSGATLVAQVNGGVPPASPLAVNGALAIINGTTLTLGAAPTGNGTVKLFTDASRKTLVTTDGTYPLLTVPATEKDALDRFTITAACGNDGGRLTVACSGETATLNIVIGGSFPQPTCGVEGTNGNSTVVFDCLGYVETVGDVNYLVPGKLARLRAKDTTGGTFVGCWRDESTGDIFWGDDVILTPTNRTIYTTVCGSAWFRDKSADPQTISNGEWTFGATAVAGYDLMVTNVISAPTSGATLNFALPITNAVGKAYKIVMLGESPDKGSLFGTADNAQRLSLTNLYLSGDTTNIGHSAFSYCTNLTGRVVTPQCLTTIGKNAFQYCINLKEVVLSGVEIIDEYAFRGCKSLKKVRLSENLKSIGKYGFNGDGNLESVTPLMPDSLVNVGRAAFYQAKKLGGILRMKGVKRVCYSGFQETAFDEVEMPSITNLGYRAFYKVPATNYVFGTDKVCFNDEEYKSTSDNYKGNGYQPFYIENNNERHFHFPGLAPDMPVRAMTAFSYRAFGSSAQKNKVVFHGSWRMDKEGWNKILAEIGTTDVSGTLPKLQAGDRRVKGQFRWYYSDSTNYTGWLIDTRMPNEPIPGTILNIR